MTGKGKGLKSQDSRLTDDKLNSIRERREEKGLYVLHILFKMKHE